MIPRGDADRDNRPQQRHKVHLRGQRADKQHHADQQPDLQRRETYVCGFLLGGVGCTRGHPDQHETTDEQARGDRHPGSIDSRRRQRGDVDGGIPMIAVDPLRVVDFGEGPSQLALE